MAAAMVSGAEQDIILPRGSPHVGFLRHSPNQANPKQAMHAHFATLRKWRARPEKERGSHGDAGECDHPRSTASGLNERPALKLPRESPYVGSHRHAPPSPILCFSKAIDLSTSLPPLLELPAASVPVNSQSAASGSSSALEFFPEELAFPGCQAFGELSEDMMILILSFHVEVSTIGLLARLARGYNGLLKSELVWANRIVRVPPSMIASLAPVLGTWLPAWRRTSRFVIPRSAQLISEVTRLAPDMPIEVAWRFDAHVKGDGVEVINHGCTVRRIEDVDEELVVLGDAPLPTKACLFIGDASCRMSGRAPYLEVILDHRTTQDLDDLNDFGIGVTACPPTDIDELGAVADEVPCSWVVDFTQSSVILSVNNCEAARGHSATASDLREGDKVGIRVTPAGTIEIFINSKLRQHLVPSTDQRVPQGVDLFPVLDLYGCTVQLSRTDADEP